MKMIIYTNTENMERQEIARIALTKEEEKSFEQKSLRIMEQVLKTRDLCIGGFHTSAIKNTGLKSVYHYPDFASSMNLDTECYRKDEGYFSAVIGSIDKKMELWQNPVTIMENGKEIETNVYLGLLVYREGYVISVGKNKTSFLGNHSMDMYFEKITTRQFKSTSLDECKLFPDFSAMRKYLEKNRSVFEMMARKYGYTFSVCLANRQFEEEENQRFYELTEKKQQKLMDDRDALMKLLHEINQATDLPSDEDEEIPDEVNETIMVAEAEKRMRSLGLEQLCLRPFRKGKLFQSEAAGFLYNLDEEAVKAVEYVKQCGGIPYHVIKNKFTFGVVYTVLYVSTTPEDWEFERYNYETGQMIACCWMVHFQDAEIGTVGIRSENGGLVRIE